MANFSCLPLELNGCHYIFSLSRIFTPIGELNRSTQLQHSRVKYKYFFHNVLLSASPSSMLKLPKLPIDCAGSFRSALNSKRIIGHYCSDCF